MKLSIEQIRAKLPVHGTLKFYEGGNLVAAIGANHTAESILLYTAKQEQYREHDKVIFKIHDDEYILYEKHKEQKPCKRNLSGRITLKELGRIRPSGAARRPQTKKNTQRGSKRG